MKKVASILIVAVVLALAFTTTQTNSFETLIACWDCWEIDMETSLACWDCWEIVKTDVSLA